MSILREYPTIMSDEAQYTELDPEKLADALSIMEITGCEAWIEQFIQNLQPSVKASFKKHIL